MKKPMIPSTGHELGGQSRPPGAARRSPSFLGRYCLVKDMNCASATLEAFQDVFGLRDDLLLKAATGLEGGVVAGGATCGVITAGALGLAQLLRERTDGNPEASPALTKAVADYVRWFDGAFGATSCRRLSGVDFHSPSGLARYFLPGDRVLRCISHIGKALAYLQGAGQDLMSGGDGGRAPRPAAAGHCASAVLEGIRKRTGLGDPRIEEVATVLSGGVGLSGGVCGALAGAVMGVNLLVGMDVRRHGRIRIMRDFAVGHLNLLISRPGWMPEPFGIGREILGTFRDRAGSTLCSDIVGRRLSDPADLSAHLSKSPACRNLIELSIDLGASAIERWR